MKNFIFNPETFVSHGHGSDKGEWIDQNRKEIAQLRELYPELAHWGDLAIGTAFGDFSNDVLEVGWAVWMIDKRDEGFLTYCCWRQLKGTWNFGMFFEIPNREVLSIWNVTEKLNESNDDLKNSMKNGLDQYNETRKKAEESINRGARITKHRIKL